MKYWTITVMLNDDTMTTVVVKAYTYNEAILCAREIYSCAKVVK